MVSLQSKLDSLSDSLVENEEENTETEAASGLFDTIEDESEMQMSRTASATNGHPVRTGDNFSSYNSFSSDSRRRAASLEWPPRKQSRTAETVEVGCLNVISAKYESLDYDVPDSDLLLDEERTNGLKYETKKNISRWIIFMFIGVITAGVGITLDIIIDKLSEIKYGTLKHYVDQCVEGNCLYFPYLMWVGFNVSFVLVGSLLVTYVEPVAAGSGIPQVKCYLNGVKIPRVVRIKTLLVKVIGVISSVVGGLAVGKEGPMIHSGAVVAAGISQGKSTSLNKDFNFLHFFREDHEKRDFVSGGAAAGVAAAFGSPVGGVLFSLEEGTSFWNQSLTWRVFLSAMISTFTLNGILSMYHGFRGQLWYAGLLSFGKFPEVSYYWFELIIYMLMGLVGGLFGSLFNFINYRMTVFRMRYINSKLWMKVVEASLVAATTATVGFAMIFFLNDCRPLGQDPTKFPIQVFCGDGEYNALGALWFQTPETSVRSLFHDPAGSHKASSLSLFFVLYFLLSIWTYGLSVSAGLFIPSLLTGAAWGRLTGMALMWIFPDQIWVDLRKYALVGAAAQLGGVVRMTISLTVILIEATGSIAFGLPLMLTLICAKWMGDFFNEGIYDIHIMLSGVPFLPWEPPPMSHDVYASEIMSHPVVVLRSVERVARIVQILTAETHNGFPVVDPGYDHQTDTIAFGKLRGLILRHQLIVLLQNKIFNENVDLWDPKNKEVSLKIFRDQYPRYKQIQDISLSSREMGCTVDLRPFMNSSPYNVIHSMTLPRVFRLFRALGLRHLPVINDTNQVVGMITRKDLVRYRANYHGGKMTREELKISEKI